jgi:DUF1680 family protein
VAASSSADAPRAAWPNIALPPAKAVTLGGPLGLALSRGVKRLEAEPYTEKWLRADVSFEISRIFTNYSGDSSGRYIELAALTSPPKKPWPAALTPLMKTIARHQKPDGHFGADVDLTKPLAKNSPPIPMLWGNARLLVGLIAAAQEFHDEELLRAARRLGDFYVASADQLCAPAREAEFRSSGTYGDGYTCCYFPAIEGLALLYRQTKDDRYLKQAQRMAEWFRKFDALPVDHSHGNLCAWRGILMLYEITGDRAYLDATRAKWDAAMKGSYVWPLGGVGEHWHVNFHGDEGCSESDWLRLNLDLWRFTGEARYLDLAERLLENQYAKNQCPNGGYGMCHLDGDAAGPIAAYGQLEEWPFCCSFHGPLGLHFSRSYLATGSDRGVIVNFPVDFTAPVRAGARDWLVKSVVKTDFIKGTSVLELEVAPQGDAVSAATALLVRVPRWATSAKAAVGGEALNARMQDGYLRIEREFKAGEKIAVTFQNCLALEGRRFEKATPAVGKVSRLHDVGILAGPKLLFAAPAGTSGRPVLLATIDGAGQLGFPGRIDGGYVTVALPGLDVKEDRIPGLLQAGKPVLLRPLSNMPPQPAFRSVLTLSEAGRPGSGPARRAAFMADLVVVPSESVAGEIDKFQSRAKDAENQVGAPVFGENLEKRPEVWPAQHGWKFTPEGLLVSGGDIGLVDGEGYKDYRFEFELVLPKEGQGLAGWMVRAADANNCLMFQLQAADSTYHAPEYKTRPNTLRPHVRRNGQWQLAEPVPLGKEFRRGEPHKIAVECRQDTVEVFLDGERIHTQSKVELRGGAVGFRAATVGEQGLFRAVALRALQR